MKRSENYGNVTAALLRAKSIISTLPLVKDAQGDKAKYIRLATLNAALEPVLLANDLMILQGTGAPIADGLLIGVTMETTVLHVSGEWMSTDVIIPVAGSIISKKDGGGRNPIGAQDGGISLTYARRYGIFAFFNIAVDEDTDGAERSQSRRKRALAVAEGVAERTQARTDALRDKLTTEPKIVRIEQCLDCHAIQGQRHDAKCPNA